MLDTMTEIFFDAAYHRQAFLCRLRAWLETPEGASHAAKIKEASVCGETDEGAEDLDLAWRIAERAFETAHPERRQVRLLP